MEDDRGGERTRSRVDRRPIAWLAIVILVYTAATLAVVSATVASGTALRPDRAMELAANFGEGRVDLDEPPGGTDIVVRDGRTYHVLSVGPIVPYVPFVPIPALHAAARWIVAAVLGIVAAWLAWPLAERYGPGGRATWWLAALGAFGTLLLTQAVQGNQYYLAHVEAMLFTFLALVEYAGRRRPWVLGVAMGLAILARPTVGLAAVPIGLALMLDADRRRRLLAYAAPIAAAIAVMALYNLARFGSPFETGYGLATLTLPELAERRELGLFSLAHVPDNLALLIGQGFEVRQTFPHLVPSPHGHSILLTTPALLVAVGAGWQRRTERMLWVAAGVVLLPLLLYYGGGGYRTFGHRYFLDVVPFLLALVAIAARTRFGALERLLVALSIAFCAYGLVWIVFEQLR